MDRIYEQEPEEPVKFFIGREVEHTACLDMLTLFVVDIQDTNKILELAYDYKCQHVFFGANHSFESYNPGEDHLWIDMIASVLSAGYWATLDFDVRFLPRVQTFPFANFSRFVPLISVKMPYVEFLNKNSVVKIDDIDFDRTTPGVWCHSLNELISNENCFTSWSKYQQDKVIKD